ncbi:MAG: hypothetical protein GF313_06915 [Caldithrix sp.]|nr:hypothetical protein [Caldithrix sp.]
MNQHIRHFITYLKLEKHYSANTLKSYSHDLHQVETFVSEFLDTKDINWTLVNKNAIRQFLMYLQEMGISRRTVGRKLASL